MISATFACSRISFDSRIARVYRVMPFHSLFCSRSSSNWSRHNRKSSFANFSGNLVISISFRLQRPIFFPSVGAPGPPTPLPWPLLASANGSPMKKVAGPVGAVVNGPLGAPPRPQGSPATMGSTSVVAAAPNPAVAPAAPLAAAARCCSRTWTICA